MNSRLVTLATIVISALAALASGCAAQVLTVTYHSDPEGAMLYEGSRLWGYTPISLTYPGVTATLRQGQCARLNGSMVRWASGAEARIDSLSACASVGWNTQFVFLRPSGLPGRELDAQFALQLQQNAMLQQQAQAQQDLVLLSIYNTLTQQNFVALQRSTLKCTSTPAGNSVTTTCR